MSIYIHRCPKCEKEFDDIRPMNRMEEEVKCPECGEVAPRAITKPGTGIVIGGTPKFYPGRS
jgi:putative FmdB family regulatory protein